MYHNVTLALMKLIEYERRRRDISIGLASALSQRKERTDDNHDT